MSTIKTIAQNTLFIVTSQVIVTLIGFFLFIYIARDLGEVDFGVYNFALTFTSLFSILADIGISTYLVREIARNKEIASEFFSNIVIIKIVLSTITFCLIVVTINILNYPSETIYIIYLFGIYSILNSFTLMISSFFRAFEKMQYVALFLIIEKLVIFPLVLFVLFLGYGLIGLAYVHIFSIAIVLILITLFLFTKLSKPAFKTNYPLSVKIVYGSIPFGLNAFFGVIFLKIDTIMLSIMAGDAAVGIYNAAYIPILTLLIFPDVFLSSLFPIMSRHYALSKDSLDNFILIPSKFLLIIGIPIAVGCIITAPKLISLFFGRQYLDSILPFQILSIFIPIRFLSATTGPLLNSINRENLRTFGVGLGALINIIVNIILIPIVGYIGACIATVFSEIFLYFILFYFIKISYKKISLHHLLIKPIVASCIMGIFIYYLININIFLLVLLSSIIYFCIILLLRVITQDEWKLIQELFKREKKIDKMLN